MGVDALVRDVADPAFEVRPELFAVGGHMHDEDDELGGEVGDEQDEQGDGLAPLGLLFWGALCEVVQSDEFEDGSDDDLANQYHQQIREKPYNPRDMYGRAIHIDLPLHILPIPILPHRPILIIHIDLLRLLNPPHPIQTAAHRRQHRAHIQRAQAQRQIPLQILRRSIRINHRQRLIIPHNAVQDEQVETGNEVGVDEVYGGDEHAEVHHDEVPWAVEAVAHVEGVVREDVLEGE